MFESDLLLIWLPVRQQLGAVAPEVAKLGLRAVEGCVEPAGREAAHAIDARSLLARLKPRARAVVVLHELEGFAHADIAALFGQSESWSKSQLARSLAYLREEQER